MWDQHLHSHFSADSEAAVTDIVNNAVRKGLEGICFTDHIDLDYPKLPEEPDFVIDWENYHRELDVLAESVSPSVLQKDASSAPLLIHKGVELGLQNRPSVIEGNAKIAREQALDFIIGSIHVIDGEDPYYGRYFTGKTKKQAYEQYFRCTLENIKAFTDFDVLGHIDYMIRYAPYMKEDGRTPDLLYSYEDYADLIDAILKNLIESGRGIEINSAGIRKGAGTVHPEEDVIRRYRELGGEILTFGSDAHVAEDIGADLDLCSEIAQKCGFRYYTVFEGRSARFFPL